MTIKSISAVGAVAICALTIAVATAVGDADPPAGGAQGVNSSSDPGMTDSAGSAPIQGARKPLPAIAAAQLEGIPGAVPSESVAVLEVPAGTLYVTPTADGACLSFVRVGVGAGLTCAPLEPTIHFEGCTSPVGQPPTCERAFIYGLVLAGVDRVDVRMRDGSLKSAGVTTGAYLLDVPAGDPAAVEFEHGGERVHQSLPLPATTP